MKRIKLTGTQTELLLTIICVSGWYMSDDNFLDMAKLAVLGMLSPVSDYDGMMCSATKRGLNYAINKHLVQTDENASFSRFSRTEKGWRYHNKYGRK